MKKASRMVPSEMECAISDGAMQGENESSVN